MLLLYSPIHRAVAGKLREKNLLRGREATPTHTSSRDAFGEQQPKYGPSPRNPRNTQATLEKGSIKILQFICRIRINI